MSVRARWCQICHQTPPGVFLQPLPQLEAILPEYEHTVCSFEPVEAGGFNASLKLRIREEQEVQMWLKDFQTSSKITWRILKTHPTIQKSRRTKYRIDFRCQHGGHKRNTSSKKNTFCPALMFLTLKKEIIHQSRRTRPIDPHVLNQLTFHVTLRSTHNHQMNGPECLKYRDVSKETIEKLKTLFEKGHSPSLALKALKNELRAQMGESFEAAAADRALCPDLQFCFRLFYKIYPHKKIQRKNQKATVEARFDPQIGTAPCDKACKPLPNGLELQKICVSSVQAQDCPVFRVIDLRAVQTPSSWRQCSDTENRLRGMFDDLLQKLKTDETFEEPVKAMLCSYETMSTNEELVSALNTFGKRRKGNMGDSAKKARIQKSP